jgi:hypothetical protein
MSQGFEDRARYWEASRKARESFYRYTLADLLAMVFDVTETPGGTRPPVVELPEDEFVDVVRLIQDRVIAVEAAWAPSMDEGAHRLHPSVAPPLPSDARAQVGEAFATLRKCAQAVAEGRATPMHRLTMRIYIPLPSADRDGRPRWMLRGRLADGIVWMGIKLLTEVDRSLIRACAYTGCSRIFVAFKNQRYCLHHQAEAHRLAQRRAEQAFRARQHATKPKTKKRRAKR